MRSFLDGVSLACVATSGFAGALAGVLIGYLLGAVWSRKGPQIPPRAVELASEDTRDTKLRIKPAGSRKLPKAETFR